MDMYYFTSILQIKQPIRVDILNPTGLTMPRSRLKRSGDAETVGDS